jgi:hypothetical protein
MSKSLIERVILGSTLALSLLLPGLAAEAQEMATYRDAKHAFALSYPTDWQPVQFKDGPDFHVVSAGGKGPEDCNVIVTRVSGPAYLDRVNQNAMLGDIRQAVADAQFKEWRRQTLGRRWGIYYVIDGTVPKQPLKQTTIGMQVVVGSKLYTVSCSAPTAAFEQQRSMLDRIVASLAF